MARLLVSSEHFDLEFDSPSFDKANRRASSLAPGQHSLYRTEGVPASVRLDGAANPLKRAEEDCVENGDPFFFDNTQYTVWLQLKNGATHAEFRHEARIVSDCFSRRGHASETLYGVLDFENDVGRFPFSFDYMKDGRRESFTLTFEVLSQKLDYHEDWRSLVDDIESRYPLLAFDCLKRTYHAFGRSAADSKTKDLVWWSLFKSLQDPFVRACRLVLRNPRHRLRRENDFLRADQLRVLSPALENEWAENRFNPAHRYVVPRESNTRDTPENRFVKFAVRDVSRRYAALRKVLLDRDASAKKGKLDATAKQDMAAMKKTLSGIAAHPFFRGIGKFEGLRQQSPVLLRAPGYSTIYRTYVVLKAAYLIREGLNRIETKDIADLYEIWCFLKVEEFAEAALPPGTKVEPPDPTHGDFVQVLSTGVRSTVVFRTEAGVELARVVYNPEIGMSSKSGTETGVEGTVSPTSLTSYSSQDPDIVLRLTNRRGPEGFALTYLFDAKYRLEDLKGSAVGQPPQDAIDQMHRYRDAIYYAPDDKTLEPAGFKKEIIGGYILFPGKEATPLERPTDGHPDHRLPYVKSIDRVNIGAIPLRPNVTATEDALKDFVKKLVEGSTNLDDVFNHVNPHKGAVIPVATPTAVSDVTVFGTYHGKRQLRWIEGNLLYNMPVDEAGKQGIASSEDAARKKVFVVIPPWQPRSKDEVKTFEIVEFLGLVSAADLAGRYRYYHMPTHSNYWLWQLKPARDAAPS